MDERVRNLESELKAHEVQCEERWKTTFTRLNDIENVLERIESKIITAAGAAILFLGGLVITLGMALLERI